MTDQLFAGVQLMLVGMGLVFLFLALLVVTVDVMSFLIRRYTPQPPPPSSDHPRAESTGSTRIAVIAAAVHRYRAGR